MVMVDLSDLNWLHIGVATLVGMVVGWLWYSPVLFGAQWMKAMRVTAKDITASGSSPVPYIKGLVGHFVTAVAIAELVHVFAATTLWEGVQVGLVVGIGLIVALQMVHLAFKGNKTLTFINTGYDLVVILLMAGLLAMW
jgi:hypothetical protein